MPDFMDQQLVTGRQLLEVLLGEQQDLTAATKFAKLYKEHQLPAQARYYRDLIPLDRPAEGQQYAFAVDLDACTGCKACVTACHRLNGLDEHETWRDVGLLLGGTIEHPVQQTVTTACHHCLQPACRDGCPVLAYEKDPRTGIVRHLDDQCIGCQYCILKCPYDVPKYSKKRGIVRKCDMCSSRLAIGEAPACVQACPSQAIRIEIVDQRTIAENSRTGAILPGAPTSDYTQPTTLYRSTKELSEDLRSWDDFVLTPQDGHPALVIMLVLTQSSVGVFLVLSVLCGLDSVRAANVAPTLLAVALGLGVSGLAASVLHLGRPLQAWRAFLGVRTSWLSREIIMFGIFIAGVTLETAADCWPQTRAHLAPLITWLVCSAGLFAVFCSAMIYQSTRRPGWSRGQPLCKFFGTTVLLGSAVALFCTGLAEARWKPFFGQSFDFEKVVTICLLLTSAAKLTGDCSVFVHLRDRESSTARRTARLLIGPLAGTAMSRYACGLTGGIFLPVFALIFGAGLYPATGMLLLCATAEILERQLFFKAVMPLKMPGPVTVS